LPILDSSQPPQEGQLSIDPPQSRQRKALPDLIGSPVPHFGHGRPLCSQCGQFEQP